MVDGGVGIEPKELDGIYTSVAEMAAASDRVATQVVVQAHQSAAVVDNVIGLGAAALALNNTISDFANGATGIVTISQNSGHGAIVQQSVIMGGEGL